MKKQDSSRSRGIAALFRAESRGNAPETSTVVKRLGRPKFAIEDPFPVYSSCADDYELQEEIGHGSSSTVYLAKFKPLGIACAVKEIDVDRLSQSNIGRLRHEASIMSLSKHPNVLRVRGEWLRGTKLYVAARLMAAGSLLDIMAYAHSDGFTDEAVLATILKQMLEGLLYFHENGWLHRDIKAANALVDEDGTVLLADFGVSSVHLAESRRISVIDTPSRKSYNSAADIWSFAITALELSTGQAPYAYMPASKALHKTVFEDAPTVAENGSAQFSKAFKDLVDSCLRKDPAKRPTARKLLSHAFFKQAKRPSYLVSTILEGLPPLQARQVRRRNPSEATARTTHSWDFGGTTGSRATLSPLTSPNDPFASFTGRHDIASTPTSPVGSQFVDLPDDPQTSLPRQSRRISFSVAEMPSKTSVGQITGQIAEVQLNGQPVDLVDAESSIKADDRL